MGQEQNYQRLLSLANSAVKPGWPLALGRKVNFSLGPSETEDRLSPSLFKILPKLLPGDVSIKAERGRGSHVPLRVTEHGSARGFGGSSDLWTLGVGRLGKGLFVKGPSTPWEKQS